jgi:hypothetical protein
MGDLARDARAEEGLTIRQGLSSRATEGRPGTHSGTFVGKAQEWIPGLRFAPPGMTLSGPMAVA